MTSHSKALITTHQLSESLEVGKLYDVPCVRAFFAGSKTLRWWPVIGPLHDDKELINFKWEHFHIDYRFLTLWRRKIIRNYGPPGWTVNGILMGEQGVYQLPLTSNLVHPTAKKDTDLSGRRFVDYKDNMKFQSLPPGWYQVRQMRCITDRFPDYRMKVGWHRALEEAYKGCNVLKSGVCPHRGADLRSLKPQDGVITCPLHGLRWNSETGEMVRRTTPERKE